MALDIGVVQRIELHPQHVGLENQRIADEPPFLGSAGIGLHPFQRVVGVARRLFEAAACATPIISDPWDGLDTFFEPGTEILIARRSADVLRYLRDLPERERLAIGARARCRVLAEHTAAHRAAELEAYAGELLARQTAA